MSKIGNGVKVGLFVTCIVDQMWASVGTSTVEVLRRAGCEIEFDERQIWQRNPAMKAAFSSPKNVDCSFSILQ